jgi:hypothetical protein
VTLSLSGNFTEKHSNTLGTLKSVIIFRERYNLLLYSGNRLSIYHIYVKCSLVRKARAPLYAGGKEIHRGEIEL